MSEELENELKDLREKNNELVMKVQYWKMTAAQKENEKLDLMKEMNELRLKLSHLRSGGNTHARKLDAALQSASEDILSHLVQASSTVARMLELNKTYMQDREELDTAQPRWSTLSNTPSSEKVNRVPPMLIGGRLIQPVVSLSRTIQLNNTRSSVRSPNQQNGNLSDRPVYAMHTLQDVYIPLTRIDASLPAGGGDSQHTHNDLDLDDGSERILEESEVMSDSEEFDESRRLEAVTEEVEPAEETPQRTRQENPLEGPSWLLDELTANRTPNSFMNFEPDSTTEVEENNTATGTNDTPRQCVASAPRVCSFTPTVRRRRRSPPAPAPCDTDTTRHSPRPERRNSNNGRILKVLVAKMCLDEDDDSGEASPPKRPNIEETPKQKKLKENSPKRKTIGTKSQGPIIREMSPSKRLMRFDAPSPNGSTDSRVIVLETSKEILNTANKSTKENCVTTQSGTNGDTSPTHSPHLNHDTRSHIRDVNHDIRSHSRDVNHDTRSHSRDVNHDNKSHSRDVNHDTRSHSRDVNHDTRSHSRDVNHDNKSHSRDVNHDTRSHSRDVNHDNKSHSRDVNHDTRSHSRNGTRETTQSHSRDTQSHSRDTQSHSRDTQSQSRNTQSHSRDTQSNSHDSTQNNNYEGSHDAQSHSLDSQDTSQRARVRGSSRDTADARENRDSDSSGSEIAGEGRTRRPRKAVVYKERPLNRKLRR